MHRRRDGQIYECVVVDVNTQLDYCGPEGAHRVANARELTPALRRMIAWIKRNCAPVISSVDSHRLCELPEAGCPVHCVDGSKGQRKVDYTILPLRVRVEVDSSLAIPLDLFARCQQVIFRQRGEDLLGNPKADRFLTQLAVREFIIFGNTVEGSIKCLALGLVARDKTVTVIADACGYWNRGHADLALRQLNAKGAGVITVDELSARKLDRRRRYRVAAGRGDSTVRRNGAGGNGRVR